MGTIFYVWNNHTTLPGPGGRPLVANQVQIGDMIWEQHTVPMFGNWVVWMASELRPHRQLFWNRLERANTIVEVPWTR